MRALREEALPPQPVSAPPESLGREPRLGPAIVEPPAAAPKAAMRRHTGWGYVIGWALGIGLGAVAAGAFVGFLVNGPPGRALPTRTIADVAPPSPTTPSTAPPSTTQIADTRAAPADTAAAAPPPAARPAPEPTPAPVKSAARDAPSPAPPAAPAQPEPAAQPAPAASPAPPPAALPPGEVREVQARLRALGFNPGPIDGNVGPMTAAAISRYRQSRGMADSGVADKNVLAELRQEANSTPPPAPPPPPRPRPQYSIAQSPPPPPPRQSNPFVDALNRLFGR
jgi:hypothetical protein